MSIPFTQYLRPDGRKQQVFIDRDSETEAKAQKIIDAGNRFECEELRSGLVSLTIFNIAKDQDVGIVVCPNGPAVPIGVDELIRKFDLSSQV